MKDTTIQTAADEARRFLRRVNKYQTRKEEECSIAISGSREGADLRRSSMDLTRALADMRQGR